MTGHEHHEWTDKLSDYLDGELSDHDQRALAAHLATCDECVRTLDDLRAVVKRAQTIQPVAPPADLWHDIAARMTAPEAARPVLGNLGPRRRMSFTWPELIAASILLVLVSGWAALRINRNQGTATSASANASPAGSTATQGGGAPTVAPASLEDKEYDAAVADLQRALQSGRGQLDSATVTIVEDNLAIIDQAVDDARRALAADPANADLSGYLMDTRRRKLNLLRHAAALTELNN